MDVPGPWAPSSRLRRRTRRGPTQPPCASGMPPRNGSSLRPTPPPEILGSRVAFSMGYRTGRRNAHVIREGHVIRGRCHRNGVSRGSPRRPAAGRLPCVRTQPFPHVPRRSQRSRTTREGARLPVVRHGGEMAVDRPLCRGEAIPWPRSSRSIESCAPPGSSLAMTRATNTIARQLTAGRAVGY